MTRRVVPTRRSAPGMSAAVQAGGLVYVSGQVAFDIGGELVGEGDCEIQTRQCFHNIAEIRSEVGAGLADVVQLTAYLADSAHAGGYLAVRQELIPIDPPATTTVVAILLDPRFLVS